MSSLFTRNRAEAWRTANPTPSGRALRRFVARDPQVLPPPAPAISYRLAVLAFRLVVAVVVVLCLAIRFFLLGEERPARVRPNLTPAQRARAFRLPTP